ncbi:MAG: AmmeMemoRadiSam system protein B, partial [Acidobacteriota bacterium]
MAHTSSVVFAGIAPHPPIMVPEVGREAIAEVRSSIDAMLVLTERVIQSGAETVILISPHAPLESQAFVAYDGPQLYGDFANFRAPGTAVQAELDDELLHEITRAAAAENLLTLKIGGRELDHGTAVPLYFLQRNGWSGHVVALGYSFLSNEDHVRFGKCIRAAIDKLGRPVAFIASGDLSHRLKPEAPAGFNPEAHRFDEEVVDAIKSRATSRIVEIDPELRRMAGECGYRSMLVAIGLADGFDQSCEVISYEAPFGVGYLVAQLFVAGSAAGSADILSAQRAERAQTSKTVIPTSGTEPIAVAIGSETQLEINHSSGADLPALARQVVETFVTTGGVIDAPTHLSELLSQRAGCFVSIKTRAG